MPPKKKGGKKGKKGKKSAKEEDGPISGDKGGTELNELSREFFLIQIKDLEQRLARYQRKCDELSISNTEYETKHHQLTKDRKEIVDFLKKSLEQRQDEISDLHDRLLGLQQAKDTEKEAYENQLSHLKREFQEVRDQLTSENMILGGKLSSLEEFKVQKEDLMKKFADMEEKLEQQEKAHTDKIYNLERKAVVDKDRLKKEMVLRVNTVAAEFRKVSNKQMADTTKRNIRENVSINAQLTKMSEKTKDLVQDNDELRDKVKDQKLKIQLLEATHDDLAKKNISNLKVLKMLTARARQQEEILEELEARDQEYMQVSEEASQTSTQNKELEAKVEKLEQEVATKSKKLQDTEAEKSSIKAAKERLEDMLSATAYTLHEVVTDNVEDDQVDRNVKRQTMIERLLLVLNSAALLGKAPPPAEFFQQRSKTLMAPLSMVKEIPNENSSQLAGKAREFPHYKLGDLGLIPRPRGLASKDAIYASKISHLSATTRAGFNPSMTGNAVASPPIPKHNRLPAIAQKNA